MGVSHDHFRQLLLFSTTYAAKQQMFMHKPEGGAPVSRKLAQTPFSHLCLWVSLKRSEICVPAVEQEHVSAKLRRWKDERFEDPIIGIAATVQSVGNPRGINHRGASLVGRNCDSVPPTGCSSTCITSSDLVFQEYKCRPHQSRFTSVHCQHDDGLLRPSVRS